MLSERECPTIEIVKMRHSETVFYLAKQRILLSRQMKYGLGNSGKTGS